jgi:hypothetical protein
VQLFFSSAIPPSSFFIAESHATKTLKLDENSFSDRWQDFLWIILLSQSWNGIAHNGGIRPTGCHKPTERDMGFATHVSETSDALTTA